MPEGFVYGGQTILSHPVFVETILPFLLVFTLVFAVLQKSKILGEGKKQIDAIIALVVGLLVISFGQAVGIIVQLIPFLAVSLVIILIFMLLVGSFREGKDFFGKGMKTFLLTLAIIAVIIAVTYITNAWQWLYELIFITGDSNIFISALFIIIIVAAVIGVLWKSKDSSTNE